MSLIHAVFLGIVQGLTEFLPISSSGHLVILQHLIGFKGPDVLFDTFLHMGTLLSVCVVFKGDLYSMGRSLVRRERDSPSFRLLVLIIIGTVPTALMGYIFRDFFEKQFAALFPAAVMLLVTGGLLFLADRITTNSKSQNEIRKRDACCIGIVQGLSILPGLSRSGSTISAGIFLGLERKCAARFSFLLSVPAIAGAGVLQFSGMKDLSGHLLVPLAVGTLTSALVGYGAIRILLKVVVQRKLSFFSCYCWALGCGVLLISLIRIFV